ncbi:MAG: hypothetical protein WD826_06595 [Actinomycetota bacterium]
MRRLRNDQGSAMLIAILAGMVVLTLATAGFTLASHTLTGAASLRRDVQAIHAAEAGLDRFLDYLSSAPTSAPACSLPTETVSTTPEASFTASATYFTSLNAGAPIPCGSPAIPGAVLIRSVGTASTDTRTMESWVQLRTVQGGSQLNAGAVFADSNATWTGSASVGGNPDDADLYSNGNLTLSGGGAIYGNVEARGTLSLGGNTEVKRNATSLGQMSLGGNSIIRGDARSSTSSISNGSIINGSAYYCTGSPPGGVVDGSKIQECPNPSLPLARPFPRFTYDATDWISAGYSIQTFNGANACTDARNFIRDGIASGDQVVRITNTCQLSFSGNPKEIPVKGNLAIISDGSLSVSAGNHFAPVPSSTKWKLHLLFDINRTAPCPSGTGVSFAGNTSTGGTDALIYSPCNVSFTGGSFSLEGQVIGGTVTFSSTSNITYRSVLIPGTNPNGFTPSMRYRREIVD